MKKRLKLKCAHCGKVEKTEMDWEINHRSCRLQAARLIKRNDKATKKLGCEGIAVFDIVYETKQKKKR